MSKWVEVKNNKLVSTNTDMRAFDNAIKTVKSLSVDEMKKSSEEKYVAKQLRAAQLISAYEEKRLKSKALIAEAKAAIAAKEKELKNKPATQTE